MASVPVRRKVLVLKNESSIQNLCSLLKRLETKRAENRKAKAAHAGIKPAYFDDVIVDLRCRKRVSKNEVRGVGDIRLSLMGKTLVIIVKVNGPKTLKLLEQYLTNGLPRTLLWLIDHR